MNNAAIVSKDSTILSLQPTCDNTDRQLNVRDNHASLLSFFSSSTSTQAEVYPTVLNSMEYRHLFIKEFHCAK
jgi:hypothetical protein